MVHKSAHASRSWQSTNVYRSAVVVLLLGHHVLEYTWWEISGWYRVGPLSHENIVFVANLRLCIQWFVIRIGFAAALTSLADIISLELHVIWLFRQAIFGWQIPAKWLLRIYIRVINNASGILSEARIVNMIVEILLLTIDIILPYINSKFLRTFI